MATFHPAPWSYEVHELSHGYSAIVYDAHGTAIVDHLDEATAARIAAAPELYEALLPFANTANSHRLEDGPMIFKSEWFEAARDALAKARGEEVPA